MPHPDTANRISRPKRNNDAVLADRLKEGSGELLRDVAPNSTTVKGTLPSTNQKLDDDALTIDPYESQSNMLLDIKQGVDRMNRIVNPRLPQLAGDEDAADPAAPTVPADRPAKPGRMNPQDQAFADEFNSILSDAADHARFDMASLFTLMLKMLQDQRLAYRTNRDENLKDFKASAQVELDQMLSAAEARRSAEVVSAVTGIVAGCMQIAGGVASAAMAFKSWKEMPDNMKQIHDKTNELSKGQSELQKIERELMNGESALAHNRTTQAMPPDQVKAITDTVNAGNARLPMLQGEIQRASDALHELNVSSKQIELFMKLAGALTEFTNGAASLTQSSGRMAAAEGNFIASKADIEAKKASIKREVNQSDMQLSYDQYSHVKDQYSQILNTNKESAQQQNQTLIGIAGRV
jgi:uncharacterized phage infection (PIP) family protein YhgE